MATTERGARTRARLIEATAAVLRSHGYATASTRSIAAEAGVSEATIYRHFPDKAALVFAALLEREHPAVAWMAGLPARAGTDTVLRNLAESVRRLAALGAELAPIELAILTDPELARRRNASRGLPPGPPTFLADYLRREQDLGRVRSDVDVERVALVLLAMLFGMVAGNLAVAEPLDIEVLTGAVDLVVNGLTPTSTAPHPRSG